MSPLTKILLITAFVSFALVFVLANEEAEEQAVFKPSKKSVVARNLVSAKTTASAIVREHKKYHAKTGIKNFKGTTLAYVTPWYELLTLDFSFKHFPFIPKLRFLLLIVHRFPKIHIFKRALAILSLVWACY